MSMSNKEKRLAAELLEMASDEYATHTCNDLDPSILEDFTMDEKIQLAKEFHQWNGDPEEITGTPDDINALYYDWELMSFLSAKLLQESKE